MSTVPKDLKYTNTHEWAKKESNDTITIGVTDHAQHLLGDIVFIELPAIGSTFQAGQEIGVIESVKAASDLYAPLTGEVLEVNQSLVTEPALVNEAPYEKGWIIKIKALKPAEWEALMTFDSYMEKITEEEGA